MATRDYVQRSGFPGVILGLSGGIDSALTLAIAVDAIGADKITGRDDALYLYLSNECRRCHRASTPHGRNFRYC